MSQFRFRLSLRSMLIILALFSVVFAALARPNVIVAIAIFNVTLVVIGVGIVAVLVTCGERRVFWSAFTLFSTGHLMLALGPGFDGSASQALISSKLLRALRPDAYLVTRGIHWYTLAETPPTVSDPLAASFVLIGHCFFSLLAGLIASGVVWGIMPQLRHHQAPGKTDEEPPSLPG